MTDTELDLWGTEPVDPAKASSEDLEQWRNLRARVIDIARRHGWTKTEVSKRAHIPPPTFSQWFDGSYPSAIDKQSARVERWLRSFDEMTAAAARIPKAPDFIETPTAREVRDALLFAQFMPEMVVVTLGAGMGKTKTADHFVATRPHAYKVTMRPTTSTVHGMLLELALALDVNERNATRLDRALGTKLRRNGRQTLLIVDEAQNLCDQAVNQLRYFLDEYGVGIALLGNEELYGRFGGNDPKPAYAQLHSRFGLRLRQLQPKDGDVDALLAAWGIEDESITRLAYAIARKPAALRQVGKVIQLAGMYAMGDARPISAEDIRTAVNNRGLELGHAG